MAISIVDSFLLLFTLLRDTAFVFLLHLQQSIVVSMGSFGLVEKLLVKMDHSPFNFIDSSFAFIDSQHELYPFCELV
jgi:hypothetical protein